MRNSPPTEKARFLNAQRKANIINAFLSALSAAFWDASVRILEKQPLDQIRAGLDSLKEEGVALAARLRSSDLYKFS